MDTIEEMASPSLVNPDVRRRPRAGDMYLHHKTGTIYRVIGIAKDATNKRTTHEHVIYASVNHPNDFYIRLLDEFLSNDGECYRFERLAPASFASEQQDNY